SGSLPLKLAAPGGADGAAFGPTDDFSLGWLAEAMAGVEAEEGSAPIDRPILKSAWARATQEFALYQPPAVAE
ncbi:MAG: hypothetical protein AAGA78_16730, partial [Pseudomonadota bacterium]